MKRSVKISLVIGTLVLIAGGYFGYMIYQSVMGSEPISGNQETIPETMSQLPPVTRGDAE